MEFDYGVWAGIQLKTNYKLRKETLVWKAEQMASLVPTNSGFRSALEVGCAEGIVINRLRNLMEIPRCYGIDFSEPLVDFGRKKYPEINFVLSDLNSSLPFATQSFDLIILSDIIEHINDLDKFFRELQRVGRWFLFKVPLDKYIWRKFFSEPFHRSPSVGINHPDGHLRELSKKRCERILVNNGFKILGYQVVYLPVDFTDYVCKKGLLKIRWYIDHKAKQIFPGVAHLFFGGNLIIFAE